MGWTDTPISAAPTASTNGYVVSVAMGNKTYTLAATAPQYGARHVTATRTVVGAADTPGILTVTGTDLSGQTITDVIVPGANGVTVAGTKFFQSVSSIVGTGWVTNTGDDTIVMGWDAQNAVATGAGTFHGIMVNTTAAGTITISDNGGTIAVLPASVAVGLYGPYDVNWSGFLRVETSAASQITVMHTGSLPQTYAMA